ncbi:MAG: preprotein translocase subunit SecE [Gammaproteobacteria bacterium]|nr:preprotein translocase subunit SecE [Gammaproteobacteria bacterium]
MSANTTAEVSPTSPANVAKWIAVAILVAAAVIGNAYFDDQPFLYRLLGVVVLSVLAALVAAQTDKGRAFIALLKDARAEVRRVVWPTKQETAQTTGIVVLVVALMSLLLWLLDLGLGAAVSSIIG